MLYLRKVLFYLFMVAYLITCPLTILYALGVIYRPQSENGFVKTGLIYLNTVPAEATVYLGASRFAKKTPTVVRNLIPGEYQVRVKKTGFKSWDQSILVKEERASTFDHILMLPEIFESEILSQKPFQTIVDAFHDKYLILASGRTLGDYYLWSLAQGRLGKLLEKDDLKMENFKVLELKTNENGQAFYLRLLQKGQRKDVILTKKNEETKVISVADLMTDDVASFFWSETKPYSGYFLSEKKITEMDVSSMTTKTVEIQDIQGAGVHAPYLYFLMADGSVIQKHESSGEVTLLFDPKTVMHSVFHPADHYQIKSYDPDLLVFKGVQGDLIVNRLPYQLVSTGVKGIDYFEKQAKLLVWTESSIGVIDFTKANAEEKRAFETGPRVRWVFREGNKITGAFFVYEASHILFQDKNDVFLLDLETKEFPSRPEKIVSVKKDSLAYYSDDTGYLYFIDEKESLLRRVEIYPKRELIEMPFPERKELIRTKAEKQ